LKTSAAPDMISRSFLLPIRMPTSGVGFVLIGETG
jgi:hypothetical protein